MVYRFAIGRSLFLFGFSCHATTLVATALLINCGDRLDISIHAATLVATSRDYFGGNKVKITIHATTLVATCCIPFPYSTPDITIHATTLVATLRWTSVTCSLINHNPRHYVSGDREIKRGDMYYVKSQSTPLR